MQDRDVATDELEPIELRDEELIVVSGGLKAMWMD